MANIGIIGMGAVGKAVYNGFKSLGHNVVGYDKSEGKFHCDKFDNTEYAFICVPTPTLENGGQDISCVVDALEQLKGWYKGTIIIKSTVLPGTTQSLQNIYDDLCLMCSPEFLTESTAEYDFLNPDKILIGYTNKSAKLAYPLFKLLWFISHQIKVVPSEVAEMTKYMINSYYALRVTYANQIYDLCTKMNIDYEKVRDCFELDKRVAPGHFEIFYKGKKTRGYDGKCLPKDTTTLLRLSKDKNSPISLLDVAQRYNASLNAEKP